MRQAGQIYYYFYLVSYGETFRHHQCLVRVGLASVDWRDILIMMDIFVYGDSMGYLKCHKADGFRANYQIT